jgi:GAF domain-containing protein
MVDELGREAVLRAGTGEAGEKMLTEHHHLPVGGNSMIGWAIANHLPRIALDVGQEAVRFNNPNLPLTRSELALPIRVGERVLGAVTVQSERPQAFDDEDILVLQGITDSLAIALENARLFAQAQSDYKEIQALHRQYLSQSWNELSASPQDMEYTYEDGDQWLWEGNNSANDATNRLVIPMRLRDQAIGSLTLETGPQDLSPEDQTFVNAVIAQAALALENARLLENARRQAEKERVVTEIAGKAWSNADIEAILQTSLAELGKRLNASQGWIHLEMNE